ncbi:MAG: RagB/SusD family nutrient uptake outer membrane protein [Bacteroidetes bacterium]|jgi:hypothetical protein|nr:RagB/SusD family nutrient uptake outer membrane protein [Bacteroidota bacterium]
MKKAILSLTALLAITLASCDILETDPETSLDANTALSDGASAEAILLGAYSDLQDPEYYGIEYVLNIDLISDNARMQGFFDSQLEVDSKNVPFSNLWVESIWVDIYRVVNTANLLISGVPEIEDDTFTNRDIVLGESYAIRALAYFDLLRAFGYHFNTSSEFGLPLLLEPIPDNDFNQIPDLARAGVADTYQQILNDLDSALQLLDGYSDNTRMSFWAALALRARVHLYQKNYADAFNDANRVIEEGPFSLVQDLDNLFLTTDTSSESIFDLVFSDQDQSDFYTFVFQRDEYNVDPSLTNSFEEGDLRRNYIVFQRGSDRSAKYANPNNANNAKVFRLAEMYLIRSEAAALRDNNPNAGLDDLNTIRNRAGLGDIGPFASMEEYIDALLQERRVEFNYEGKRFFDLVRHDKIGEVLGMEDFRKVFPIPRNELLITGNLQQNPGFTNP